MRAVKKKIVNSEKKVVEAHFYPTQFRGQTPKIRAIFVMRGFSGF
jgi:hypothetical protein